MKNSSKKTIAMVAALIIGATSLTGCASTKNGEEETVTDISEETTSATAIMAVTETLPSETVYVVETVPMEVVTEETTVPVTEEEIPEETEVTTEMTTQVTYPIVTYPVSPSPSPAYSTPIYTQPVYQPVVTETTPAPKKDPTEEEALEIARKGFAGIVYSDDERILEYTNVYLYCLLVGSYSLDAVNDQNTLNTIDLNDTRKQFRNRWTNKLSTVEFTECKGKLTKGEIQLYNKMLREIYSGGDVLNVKTGFLNEITDAYKIELTYDKIKSGEHIYEENPYVLVVKIDDEWVLDICKPLLEETQYRTNNYIAEQERIKQEEEERQRKEEEQKKLEEERKKQEEEFKQKQEEAKQKLEEEQKKQEEEQKQKQEEAQKKQEEDQKKINEYNKKKLEMDILTQKWKERTAEFEAYKKEFEEYTAEYEKVYKEYMNLLASGQITKDDPKYLYYTTYIGNYEAEKLRYEKEVEDYKREKEEYEEAKTEFAKVQYDFIAEFGWIYA